MENIIQLLPDNIANQIAAGEVIQRPASAVKELLENAVDAGGTDIQLIIADAGKSLIQVLDNGKGMTADDARMAFARHATSKIKRIEDLFRIRTMGFRGEALASIAAVAQVVLRTRIAGNDTGILVEMENSELTREEVVACSVGTSIAMRNLFFNVPARRNFLRSNAAEMRHILDEFIRVALAFPAIFFSLTNNGAEIFHLEKGTLKQRIIQLLGNHYQSKLVSVQENTDYLNIHGFVGKPDTAKKTRGDQYLFVNNRFIRSPYLHHAIMNGYQEMIPADSFPLYVLFIDLDPSQIDINVHPTKQEIKFEDERIIYAFVQATIKHALAQFSITPAIDFDLDPSIQRLDAVSKPVSEESKNTIASSSLYKTFSQKNQAHFIESATKSELKSWRNFFEEAKSPTQVKEIAGESLTKKLSDNRFSTHAEEMSPIFSKQSGSEGWIAGDAVFYQLFGTYIAASNGPLFLLINQQSAHERILYERYSAASEAKPVPIQQQLFPIPLQLSAPDAAILQDLLKELLELGYLIEVSGKDAFLIRGTPGDIESGNEKNIIENMLEQFKHSSGAMQLSKREKITRSLARQHAIRKGKMLTENEMHTITNDLFACARPNMTPSGYPTYIRFDQDALEKLFGR